MALVKMFFERLLEKCLMSKNSYLLGRYSCLFHNNNFGFLYLTLEITIQLFFFLKLMYSITAIVMSY